ncbi:hypothetical protein NL317_31450, partial [Klebsiella pneumoniae]|nr:hypothetical protein [Klebsiella pneumoniae]
ALQQWQFGRGSAGHPTQLQHAHELVGGADGVSHEDLADHGATGVCTEVGRGVTLPQGDGLARDGVVEKALVGLQRFGLHRG